MSIFGDRQGHNSAQGDRFDVTNLQPIDAFVIEIPNSAFANKLVEERPNRSDLLTVLIR